MDLQVLVSTMNERVTAIKFNPRYSYVVVHQITDRREKEYSDFISVIADSVNVKYIQSKELGLSKSRNLAISNSTSRFGWIMDDDTVLLDEVLDNFKDIQNDELSFYSVNYFLGSNLKITGKSGRLVNKYSAAKITSINLILDFHKVSKTISFDESLGLGTLYPSGEEYVFISTLLDKGHRGMFTSLVGCRHPEITSGSDFFSTKPKVLAKFIMFDKVFGKTAKIFALIFTLKKFNKVMKSSLYMSLLARYLFNLDRDEL
ncbi:glycosyltransferase family 2 protein [Ferrimonas kyonanensis]|uniref:glycosyltransferase family 2 protein n=1 Tax=Ferrimonas kyonanensis TaxID=364763 RepID=UPI000485D005|nr:glycosyltransferase [Ferrimonas kyonanensis]